MVMTALDHLAGIARCEYAYLYVFTGNESARRLYEDLGFYDVGLPELLPDNSGRYEQLMQLPLPHVGAHLASR